MARSSAGGSGCAVGSDFTLPGVIRAELKPAIKRLRTRLENAACLKASPDIQSRLRNVADWATALMVVLDHIETDARAAAREASEARQEREG